MNTSCVAASFAWALVLFDAPAPESPATPLSEVHGKWIVESFLYNGEPVERLQGAVRDFKNGKYSLEPKMGETIEGAVLIDASQSPKAIDFEVNGRTLKGIYAVRDDTLTISYYLGSDQRPAVFESKPDSGQILIIHTRHK